MAAEQGYLLAAVKATEGTVAFNATGGGSDPAEEDEVSAKAFAEELKDLAEATQVLDQRLAPMRDTLVCTRRRGPKGSTATAQKQTVHVTVPPNPEETVEVRKLFSLGRVQQWTVEQVMDMPVTMNVETGQAQYAHRVLDVPVVGAPGSGARQESAF